jgi:hypothetical protein
MSGKWTVLFLLGVAVVVGILSNLIFMISPELRIPLEEAGSIVDSEPIRRTGTIFAGSMPVPGAIVRALPVDDEDRVLAEPVAEAVTGKLGRYALELPDRGRYCLFVTAEGHGLAEGTVQGPGEQDFAMSVGRSIAIEVRDADGRPQPGAVVLRRSARGSGIRKFICDPHGRVRCDWAGADRFGVHFGEYGVPFARVNPPEDGPVVLSLRLMYRLGGRVLDAQGAPLGGVRIRFEHAGPGATSTETDDDGAFLFTEVFGPPGSFLVVHAEGYPEQEWKVVPGDEELLIRLRRPTRLPLRVENSDGQPVSGATVRLEENGRQVVGETGEDGTVELVPLGVPGEFSRLEIDAPEHFGRTVRPGPFPPEDPLLIVLAEPIESWIVLQVRDGDGKPLPGVDCYAGTRATTDEDGRAAVRAPVPAGESFPVSFSAELDEGGFRDVCWSVPLVTFATAEATPAVVSVPGELEVTFAVVDRDGQEVSDAQLTVRPGYGGEPLAPVAGGRYRLLDGVATTWSVSALDFLEKEGELIPGAEAAAQAVRIVLSRGARLVGSLEPDLQIAVNGAVVDFVSENEQADVRIPSGPVTITLSTWEGELRGCAEVELEEGETFDLRTIPAVGVRTLTGRVLDEDGAPVGGVSLGLRSSIPGQRAPQGSTPADGSFSFHIPDAGEWVLLATKPGRAADYRVIESGADADPITLCCPRGDATLRVKIEIREPGSTFDARLRFPETGVSFRWPHRRDRRIEGDYLAEFQGLPPGLIEVVVSLPPDIVNQVELAAGESVLTVFRIP